MRGEFHARFAKRLRYHGGMRLIPKRGCSGPSPDGAGDEECVGTALGGQLDAAGDETTSAEEAHLLRTVGWVSAALGALAIGLIVGREIRQRYKFNRRTPYDLYAHSGDEMQDADCGVGI